MRRLNTASRAAATASTFVVPFFAAVFAAATSAEAQDVVVRAKTLHTAAGPAIEGGVVVVRGGKIVAVGRAADVAIPAGLEVLEAAVATPGLIDAHTVVGFAGYLNQSQDQDQVDRSAPIQPELRAIDAYNARERLIDWVRGFGVTTIHTGHGPLSLVSGQTMIVKTRGDSVEKATIVPRAMMAATLGSDARGKDGKSPGTAGKQLSMVREALIGAQEYRAKVAAAAGDPAKLPARDLRKEALVDVLEGRTPLLVTAQRHQEIRSALRLAEEFKFKLVLDGCAEAYLAFDAIKAADVPVLLHPPMARFSDDLANASRSTPKKARDLGVRFAFQSGYEDYVPKTRVVLYEAAIAAAHGLGFEAALQAITLDAASILGLSDRIGSLEIGKDGDLALFDGDPFEYVSHCEATIIEGVVVHRRAR